MSIWLIPFLHRNQWPSAVWLLNLLIIDYEFLRYFLLLLNSSLPNFGCKCCTFSPLLSFNNLRYKVIGGWNILLYNALLLFGLWGGWWGHFELIYFTCNATKKTTDNRKDAECLTQQSVYPCTKWHPCDTYSFFQHQLHSVFFILPLGWIMLYTGVFRWTTCRKLQQRLQLYFYHVQMENTAAERSGKHCKVDLTPLHHAAPVQPGTNRSRLT